MLASRLKAIVGLLAATAWLGCAATTASADSVPLPAGATGSYALTSTSCPAAGECVAVGSYTDSTGDSLGLIETESNNVWSAAEADLSSLPSVVSTQQTQLTSVSCAGVGDCVAVGSYYDAHGPEGLIETETNGSWSAAKLDLSSLPNVNGVPNVSLTSVSCPSHGDCTAVGDYDDGPGNQQGLLASESNGNWSASEAGVGQLGGASEPFTTLTQVSCASAGDCAAVGSYADTVGNTLAFIATESGGNWGFQGPVLTQLPSVAPWGTQDAALESVSCPSSGSCTAVGTYIDGGANGGSFQGMLLSYSNGSWSPASEATLPSDANTTGNAGFPGEADLALNGISCASAGNCTAVGSYDSSAANNVQGLVMSEVGGVWEPGATASLPSGAAGNPEASLDSVFCTSPGTCVAAGTDQAGDGNNAALIERQSAGVWTTAAVEQTSGYSFFQNNLASVSCAPDGYCATAGNTADLGQNTSAFLLDSPAAVDSLRAVASGKTAAVLTWDVPKDDTFDPAASGYTVTVNNLSRPSRGGQTVTGTSGGRVRVTGLTPGDHYTFTVDETSVLGTGIRTTSGSVALGLTRHQISLSLARLLAPRGPASRVARLRRTHDYTFNYRPPESGRVSVRWYETTRQGKHRDRHLVASASARPSGTAAIKVRDRLTAFGRQAVSDDSRLRLTANVKFTSGSTSVTRTHTFTLH